MFVADVSVDCLVWDGSGRLRVFAAGWCFVVLADLHPGHASSVWYKLAQVFLAFHRAIAVEKGRLCPETHLE